MAPEQVVDEFNAAINRRDLAGLAERMTEDHQFIDSANAVLSGKAACLDAWRGFFDAFPDYRNTFTRLSTTNNVVAVEGFSSCSVAELDGPALWKAMVADDRIALWRVYHDTPANRAALGL